MATPQQNPESRKIIAMAGTHRVGKTTSAQYLSTYLHGEFIETALGRVTQMCDLPRTGATNIVDLCTVQGRMLSQMSKLLLDSKASTSRHLVYDRSPIDLAAYLLAQLATMKVDIGEDYLNTYISATITATEHLTHIIYIPPNISPAANATSFDLDEKRLAIDTQLKTLLLHPDIAKKVIYVPDDAINVFTRLAHMTEALNVADRSSALDNAYDQIHDTWLVNRNGTASVTASNLYGSSVVDASKLLTASCKLSDNVMDAFTIVNNLPYAK